MARGGIELPTRGFSVPPDHGGKTKTKGGVTTASCEAARLPCLFRRKPPLVRGNCSVEQAVAVGAKKGNVVKFGNALA